MLTRYSRASTETNVISCECCKGDCGLPLLSLALSLLSIFLCPRFGRPFLTAEPVVLVAETAVSRSNPR